MVEFIAMNLGYIVFLIFILFFVLAIVVKDKAVRFKVIKIFSIIALGVLVIMGSDLIFTAIRFAPRGELGRNQLIQIGGGLLLIGSAIVTFYILFIAKARATRRLERRKKEYPNAPWMWIDKWSEKRIVYSSTGSVIFVWFVMLVVIGGFGFVPYLKREAIFSDLHGRRLLETIAVFSFFFLFFFFCVFLVVSWTRGQLKFRKSIFKMSTHPGVVGGELAGTIYTNMRNISKDGFILELQCELTDLNPGKGLSPTPVTLWKAKNKVRFEEVSIGPDGVSVPVSFSIPADAQESDEWSPDKRIGWILSAFSSLEGVKYLSQFDVPVFKTSSKP